MIQMTETTWHQESYDRFLQERLPELLSERLPLAGYSAEFPSETTARVTVSVLGSGSEISATFDGLHRPDREGMLWLGGDNGSALGGPAWAHPRIVLPYADQEDLEAANIKCIGEHLYDYVEARLGEAPAGLSWDEALLRSWLPIDTWFDSFYHDPPTSLSSVYAQWLDKTNWLARKIHARRLVIPSATGALTFANIGRVSPLETPEGGNVNKICSVAMGAVIRDGKLVIVDDSPEAGFGLPAMMIPFIEHSADARLIMSCNMMRQWLPTAKPEPAIVQTGYEPDTPGFWCGRSLLTAYAPWGADTFEDAVVISESCARRFSTEPAPTQSYREAYTPLQAGDRLSNRHGAKCTVSRILPDDEMPHLNGAPVDLVYSPSGVITRLNLGQLWEAAAGRIAHLTGEPFLAPPFRGPSQEDLRALLKDLGLPEDGLDLLTLGKDGPALDRTSCVGWVYWGRLDFEAITKISYTTGAGGGAGSDADGTAYSGQTLRHLEYAALREIGAYETIRELYQTRSTRNPEVSTLAARIAQGPVEQSPSPSPAFANLTSRLAAAGIKAERVDAGIEFALQSPDGGLELARPVAHPWLRGTYVASIGVRTDVAEYEAVVKVNAQVERLIRSGAPETLVRKGVAALETNVGSYFEALVSPEDLRWSESVVFSGRAVLSPDHALALDQISLPDEMAWALFAPMLMRDYPHPDAIVQRTPEAARALDALMERSWVLLSSPTLYSQPEHVHTPLLALRPRRDQGSVIRIPAAITSLMNADFDGDLGAVFLPVTEAGQREAGALLTLNAFLARNPRLLENVRPSQDAHWGLAQLSLSDNGRAELIALGIDPPPAGLLTKGEVTNALMRIFEREGLLAAIGAAERLRRRGFEAAKRSGWSIGPFLGRTLDLPPKPGVGEWLEKWPRYAEELTDMLTRQETFEDNDLDPARLSIMSGARGVIRLLLYYVIGWGSVKDIHGDTAVIRRGLVEGLTPQESTLLALGLRQSWYREVRREMTLDAPQPVSIGGRHVLARAMRAQYPGAVFARAAAAGETDPLTETDSRLFVGLEPRRSA
ncbi:hypothetical protein CCAX7_004480 [Capsulimonas corticalis]|uniref:DNA-directed RNA polymerase n=1 Tax=Capsulimonas corticalis TaxID=2219043 RepID=A0A402D2U4_9BACT|nr:hypothetical protein [Capsulimonas corticalis]BDI28397.1 hypothetical protein CCAX7_004480 [Capsulimonas corticalis]